MTRPVISLSLMFTLALALASVAVAQPGTGVEKYRVRKGDTLELLAAEYYGNRVHKIYIMVENGMDHERALKPGERLRIPVSERVTAAAGDTLAGLAQSYLGGEDKAGYLAAFNNLKDDTTLALGQEILVPMRVRYRAKGNEKLRDIALGLFADGKQAQRLKEYNGLESDELVQGQVITVPVPKVEVQASKRKAASADAAARAEQRMLMTERAIRLLPMAQSAWTRGDFLQAKGYLTQIELEYLDVGLAIEVGVLLGATYVAYDDDDSALATFAKVLQRSPDLKLDPRQHSPKVTGVWERAQQARQ